MTIRFPNPLHPVWRYLRGDDLREADAATVARAVAARAAMSAGTATADALPPMTLTPRAPDRRRM